MKRLILILCVFLTTPLIADDDPKSLLIYTSSTPPTGVTKTEWNAIILDSAGKWFSQPGCSITIIDDINNCDVAVMTKNLTHKKVYAHCRKPWNYSFPFIPNSNSRVIIEVNSQLKSLPGHNLKRTMTHEFGHAIGLPHDPRSMVSDKWPRALKMTAYDKMKAKEFQLHVRRMAGDMPENL